jgi:hypothetical protein
VISGITAQSSRVFVLSAASGEASCAISSLFLNHETRNKISLPLFLRHFSFFFCFSFSLAFASRRNIAAVVARTCNCEKRARIASHRALASIHFLALKIILCRVALANRSAVGLLLQVQTKIYEKLWSDFFFLSFCNKPRAES